MIIKNLKKFSFDCLIVQKTENKSMLISATVTYTVLSVLTATEINMKLDEFDSTRRTLHCILLYPYTVHSKVVRHYYQLTITIKTA